MNHPDNLSPALALRHRREAVITRLCEHFALDHVNADELEQLIDRAHGSTSVAELEALLTGLPDLQASAGVAVVHPATLKGSQTVIAIMGGAERRGAWVSSQKLHVLALMGGAVLDFRETPLPAGETEVIALAIMGGVEIIVPPGVRVISDGYGVMGGFTHSGETAVVASDAPTLRISGLALMGGVEVKERLPGESSGDARRRRRRDRAALRDQSRIRRLPEP